MIKEKNTVYGINEKIEEVIRSYKPFTMLLRRDNVIFERCFTPTNKSANTPVVFARRSMPSITIIPDGLSFKHIANTYKTTSNPSGEFTKLTKNEDLGYVTIEHDNIFMIIRALEINGYTLAPQDWKVV